MTGSVECARVIEYRSGVFVELQGTDGHGTTDVVSHRFAHENDGRTRSPKGPVGDGHASLVRETLEDEGPRPTTGND